MSGNSKKPVFPTIHSAALTAPSAKPRRDLASCVSRIVSCSESTMTRCMHTVQMLIPAGGADDYGDLRLDAANDVGNHGVRRGEINGNVNVTKQFVGKPASILVVLAGQRADFVSALLCYLGHKCAGLPAPE